MKKVLVIAALAMVSFANAQKGTILVGGNLGFSSNKVTAADDDETKVNAFEFNPRVGYQFNDNWTVGISGGVESRKTENTSEEPFLGDITSENKATTFAVGPFVRYSKSITEIFGVFADLDAGFQSEKNTFNSGFPEAEDSEVKGNGVYARITPAIFINVKKGFGLNVSFGGLGFDSLNYDDNGGDRSNFGLNFGETINIGISKNF